MKYNYTYGTVVEQINTNVYLLSLKKHLEAVV